MSVNSAIGPPNSGESSSRSGSISARTRRTPAGRSACFLAVRLRELERMLPTDGKDHTRWAEYVETARAYALVRADLARPEPME